MKLQSGFKNGAKKVLLAAMFTAAALLARDAAAEPTEINFSNPTVNGNGSPGTTAWFYNVATQGGVNIDMKATVLDATPGKVATFSRINGNDFRFDAGAGGNTGTRFFRVRYQFFENGTNTPRAIDEMHWSIGDLDYTGASGRTESVEVRGASAFLTDTITTLDTSQNAQTMTITGTQDMDQNDPDGNPEAVVSFVFRSRAVLEITYHVQNGSGGYYDHVADGAFPFYKPKQTTFGVYYTFNMSNDEEIPVRMDFTDMLPEGLQWDPDYEPVVAGVMAEIPAANGQDFALLDHLAFSGRSASFSGIPVPPGTGTFTLKTMATEAAGTFQNMAITKPSADSGFPSLELYSHSTIEIPDPGPVPPEGPVGTLVENFKANLCSYALFQLGGEAKASGSASVAGDVAVAPGASNSIPAGQIGGEVVNHNPPAVNLSDARTAAIGLAEDFAALPATQTFGSIKDPTTINATAADGVNVIRVNEIDLSGDKTLTLKGKGEDWFIVNVTSKMSLSGSSRIALDGVFASKVLFNVSSGVSKVNLSGSSGALGMTVLAPYSQVTLSGSSNIIGSVTAGSTASMSGSAKISGLANFGGSCGDDPAAGPDPGSGSDAVDAFIDAFTASDLGRFGWFSIGGTVHMNDWTNTISGHVGIGPGTLMNFTKGTITGDYTVDPTVTEKNGAVDDLPGPAMGNPIASTIEDLSEYKNAALALNSQAAALAPTQTFGEISETFTISGTDPGGFNVIALETLSMGTGRTFTISGGGGDWFIFNISKELKFAGGAVVVSGVPGNHILFNLLPGASEAKFDGTFTIDATVLSPHSAVNLTGAATVTGSIISGMNASMSGQATITQTSPFGR